VPSEDIETTFVVRDWQWYKHGPSHGDYIAKGWSKYAFHVSPCLL
jgi:hypothetical protein